MRNFIYAFSSSPLSGPWWMTEASPHSSSSAKTSKQPPQIYNLLPFSGHLLLREAWNPNCIPMAPSPRPSNATLLERLRDGTAKFELPEDSAPPVWPRLHFFARITSPLGLRGGWSAALNKVEHYGVQRVTGDGRCMFRALVKGMAKNRGIPLTPREEVHDADDLRMAVKEVICDSETERQKYEEAIIAITLDEPLKRYCQRIRRPDFWGGESELLVLSKLCRQPIIIYIPEREHRGRGNGFIPIAEYGLEFSKNTKQWKKRTPVRLLYSGKNHYDLLV